MHKPFVHGPATPHTEGENHRTVCIRHKRQSVSIRCRDQQTAFDLKRRLIGAFTQAFDDSPTPLHPDGEDL